MYTTKRPVLSSTECKAVVQAAEARAATHGWSTRRHVAYPTHDLPVSPDVLGDIADMLTEAVQTRLLPELAQRFELDGTQLSIQDAFVAKYSVVEGGMASLAPHEDGEKTARVFLLFVPSLSWQITLFFTLSIL